MYFSILKALPCLSHIFIKCCFFLILIYFYFFNYYYYYFFYFTILYWFCHTSTWIHHGCTHVPSPEPPSHLPPCTIPLGHPSTPATQKFPYIFEQDVFSFTIHYPTVEMLKKKKFLKESIYLWLIKSTLHISMCLLSPSVLSDSLRPQEL